MDIVYPKIKIFLKLMATYVVNERLYKHLRL